MAKDKKVTIKIGEEVKMTYLLFVLACIFLQLKK